MTVIPEFTPRARISGIQSYLPAAAACHVESECEDGREAESWGKRVYYKRRCLETQLVTSKFKERRRKCAGFAEEGFSLGENTVAMKAIKALTQGDAG